MSMKVLRLSNTLFLVLSEDSSVGYPRQHAVWFDEDAGTLACSCEHYKYNYRKKQGLACKHIQAVYAAYGVEVKVKQTTLSNKGNYGVEKKPDFGKLLKEGGEDEA